MDKDCKEIIEIISINADNIYKEPILSLYH